MIIAFQFALALHPCFINKFVSARLPGYSQMQQIWGVSFGVHFLYRYIYGETFCFKSDPRLCSIVFPLFCDIVLQSKLCITNLRLFQEKLLIKPLRRFLCTLLCTGSWFCNSLLPSETPFLPNNLMRTTHHLSSPSFRLMLAAFRLQSLKEPLTRRLIFFWNSDGSPILCF